MQTLAKIKTVRPLPLHPAQAALVQSLVRSQVACWAMWLAAAAVVQRLLVQA